MAMLRPQADALAMQLPFGATVFAEGDDGPLLVRIPFNKKTDVLQLPNDDDIKKTMGPRFDLWKYDLSIFTTYANGVRDSDVGEAASELARKIVEQPGFYRDFDHLMMQLLDDPKALSHWWRTVQASIDTVLPTNLKEPLLASFKETLAANLIGRATNAYIARRGALDGWPYDQASILSRQICDILRSPNGDVDADTRSSFIKQFTNLHKRFHQPYAFCKRICPKPECLYRRSVADAFALGQFNEAWILSEPFLPPRPASESTWSVCKRAGASLVAPGNPERVRRAGLCFGQMITEQYRENLSLEQKQTAVSTLCDIAESETA
jgi:hypothetical protein